MTDREKAIVTAYTGINMLEGERFNEFYKYLEELYGRPVYTHEIPFLDMKKKSKDDFFKLCREEPSISPRHGKITYTRFNEELWGSSSICNLCGCSWQIADNGHDNYCPNCGARMEEGEQE